MEYVDDAEVETGVTAGSLKMGFKGKLKPNNIYHHSKRWRRSTSQLEMKTIEVQQKTTL